jgi:site-specific DNA recombinase
VLWDSGGVGVKENLQKLVFPKGISYYHKKGAFLTDKVNEVFEPIPRLNCISESDKNKQGSISAALSNFVGRAGFEP